MSEHEETKDFNDFRGEPTYDTTYLLELVPRAAGSFTLGPVTATTPEGQLMSSDPIRIEVTAPVAVARTADGIAGPTVSVPSGATAPAQGASILRKLLIAFGVLSALIIALYCVLVVSARPSRSSEVVVAPEMPMSDLPDTIVGENELFALLSVRYSRDVRALTTREIAGLEPDPEDRVRVTMLLDQVRASRYADRQS